MEEVGKLGWAKEVGVCADSMGERSDFSPERIRFRKDLLPRSLGESALASVKFGFDFDFRGDLDGVDGAGGTFAEVSTLHLEAAAAGPE